MIQNYFFRSKIVILSAAIIISILDRIMSKWLTLLTHRLIQRNLGQVRKFPGIPGIHKTKQNRKRNAPKAKSKNIHRIHDKKASFALPNRYVSIADAQSKDSPGPQIIDVRTIYSNSGSRKRRMDWDSLDIGQSENSPTTQTGDLPNKVAHHQEKDKHKREKHSGEIKSTNCSCNLT